MSDFTLDWATANVDGANVISNGTDSITVTVATPSNPSADGEFVYNGSVDGLFASYPDPGTPTEVSISFSEPVSNVTFDIMDIDEGPGTWDDLVEIFAYDVLGNRLDVTFTGLDGQSTTAYTIEGEGTNLNGEPITVSISGEVASLQVVFDNGPDEPTAGWIWLSDISFDQAVIPCFTRGTMIETKHGPVLIEDLKAGDLIKTLDHGFQPILWVGSTTVNAEQRFAPVLFKKGAIGNNQDLLLSPQHRVLLQDWRAEVLFGEGEILTSAISLQNDSTILRQPAKSVEYFHIMFTQHEIVFAAGVPSESFHPGEATLSRMDQQVQQEVYALFPELKDNHAAYGPSAKSSLSAAEANLL